VKKVILAFLISVVFLASSAFAADLTKEVYFPQTNNLDSYDVGKILVEAHNSGVVFVTEGDGVSIWPHMTLEVNDSGADVQYIFEFQNSGDQPPTKLELGFPLTAEECGKQLADFIFKTWLPEQ